MIDRLHFMRWCAGCLVGSRIAAPRVSKALVIQADNARIVIVSSIFHVPDTADVGTFLDEALGGMATAARRQGITMIGGETEFHDVRH